MPEKCFSYTIVIILGTYKDIDKKKVGDPLYTVKKHHFLPNRYIYLIQNDAPRALF